MGRRILKTGILLVMMLCMLSSLTGFAQETSEEADTSGATDYKIEQVYINMPDVTAYYRSPDADGELEVYLGGEKLEQQERQVFSQTGQAVEYYVLVDISASIPGSRFSDIKESLKQFLTELRDGDQLILTTFGDQVTTVLNGSENKEKAEEVISSLENHDQNTLFFDAIDTVSDMIVKAGDSSEKRRVMIVVSDGKDCSDNTRSMESVENGLIARGIPVYTMAVENNQGDSESEIASYRGKFSALARNTGGLPWVVSNNVQTLDGFKYVKSMVMKSYRVKMQAASNKVSHQKQDFVMKFLSAGNMTDTRSVMVDRGQTDSTAPKVTSIKLGEPDEIRISFSEPVLGATSASNFRVKMDDESIPVQQVVEAEDEENCVILLFNRDLVRGKYEIRMSNITDNSNEKNALENPNLSQDLDGVEPETEEEENSDSVLDLILKWWPIVLTIVVLILIIIIVLANKRLKKLKNIEKGDGNVVIIDDKAYHADQVEEKVHIGLAAAQPQSQVPSMKVILWLSNGTDEPKRIDKVINGSIFVGRSRDCDIFCDDPMMSKQHFVLEVENNSLYVTDLQSRNGTIVNGIAINERYRLQPDDEVNAGSIKFTVQW